VEAGEEVEDIHVGDRYLVQADYRWMKTAQSNAAFGYNFEGALQEYVLLDQRAVTSPEGESMLIPAAEDLSASSIALVEPWACVEDSYVMPERRTLKAGGKLLILAHGGGVPDILDSFLATQPEPGEILSDDVALDTIADESIDDLLFFGADANLLERAFPKMAKGGLINIVQAGQRFGRPVVCPVGRLHYGGLRIIGTTGAIPAVAMASIPNSGEIREGDRIDVVGAGGPMGTMHVIRNICQGVSGISIFGGDLSDDRLAALERLARPLAEKHRVSFEAYNAVANPPEGPFGYIALMVPAPGLVAEAIGRAAQGGVINIFAGIAATVSHELDLDTFIDKNLYFIGTSGSVIEDMHIVLGKVTARTLDTNLSVAAVSGLDGAVDGIRAVRDQLMPGKILVYPSCKGLDLTPLAELDLKHPEVAALLRDGTWTKEAEAKLLTLYQGS
jgi:threonine dehydrogenase-like Zn-dependent dehydrogenase